MHWENAIEILDQKTDGNASNITIRKKAYEPRSATPSGGIIRIRFKGRRFTFLSACPTSSPAM